MAKPGTMCPETYEALEQKIKDAVSQAIMEEMRHEIRNEIKHQMKQGSKHEPVKEAEQHATVNEWEALMGLSRTNTDSTKPVSDTTQVVHHTATPSSNQATIVSPEAEQPWSCRDKKEPPLPASRRADIESLVGKVTDPDNKVCADVVAEILNNAEQAYLDGYGQQTAEALGYAIAHRAAGDESWAKTAGPLCKHLSEKLYGAAQFIGEIVMQFMDAIDVPEPTTASVWFIISLYKASAIEDNRVAQVLEELLLMGEIPTPGTLRTVHLLLRETGAMLARYNGGSIGFTTLPEHVGQMEKLLPILRRAPVRYAEEISLVEDILKLAASDWAV